MDSAPPELTSEPTGVAVLPASVVVPTYNHADRLTTCLDALLRQDFPATDYEVVIVDDGSGDHTAEVVAGYARSDTRVRYLRQPNQGPAAARNLGARHARGALVLFTDDDCVPEPDWIREMQRPFLEDPLVMAVKGVYRTRQESLVARFAQIEFETRYRRLARQPYIDFVDTYSAAFRRDLFLDLEGFDVSFPEANNEDVEFSYRMAARGCRMVFNPRAVVYHTHPDTMYKYLKVKFGRAYWRMVVYRAYPTKMKSDSYTPQTLKLQIALSFFLGVALLAGWIGVASWYWLVPIGALYFLTTIPFLASWLDWPPLNRGLEAVMSVLRRTLRWRVWAQRAWSVWCGSRPARLLARLARGLGCALQAAILGARSILKSRPLVFLWRGGRRLSHALLAGVAGVGRGCGALARALGRLMCALGRGLAAGGRWVGRWPVFRQLASGWGRLARTRVFMFLLALLMLLLRGLVMSLGVLWGMQHRRARLSRFSQVLLLVAGDVAGILLAGAAAVLTQRYALAPWWEYAVGSAPADLRHLPLMLLLFPALFFLVGLYKPYQGLSQVNEFMLLVKSVSAVTVAMVMLLYLFDIQDPRSLIIYSYGYTLAFVYGFRVVCRRLYRRFARTASPASRTRTLIVGTGEIARLIYRKLQTTSSIATQVIGLVDTVAGREGEHVDDAEILGSTEDLGVLIDRYKIQEIFISLPMLPQEEVLELVNRNSRRPGVHFHIVTNLFDLITAEVDMAEHDNIPLAMLKNENMALVHMLFKRCLDFTLSALVILVTFPFWLLIMAAIRLETDGPALFRQERVGKDGKLFHIFKFRTMFHDVAPFDYSPASPGDKRVTRVGRFLRRTSLDEFPQFINVLRGEMSLVGPRPEMPFIVAKYKDWERQRLQVKPGLTGLWQIMGRKDLPLHESLEFDFYYIKNQSLLLDLSILIKTIPIILGGRGAY